MPHGQLEKALAGELGADWRSKACRHHATLQMTLPYACAMNEYVRAGPVALPARLAA